MILRPERVVPALFGMTVLLHLGRDFRTGSIYCIVAELGVLLAGVCMLLGLRHRALYAVLLGSLAATSIWGVNNHILLLQFVALGLLLLPARHEPECREPRYFPLLRGMFAIGYLGAAIHKLNWGFLDPSVSCAANHLGLIFYVSSGGDVVQCGVQRWPGPTRRNGGW